MDKKESSWLDPGNEKESAEGELRCSAVTAEVKAITFSRVQHRGDILIEESFFMLFYATNVYQGRELLFGNGYSFIIPKASPLKASLCLTKCFL